MDLPTLPTWLLPPSGVNLYECTIKASGDGYGGKYRFVRTDQGWLLKGQGGDYLTPGIGVPIYAETPELLLATILQRRPSIALKVSG